MGRRLNLLHLIDTGGPGGAETIFHSLVTGLDEERWRSVAVIRVIDWLHGALVDSEVEPEVIKPRGGWDAAYLANLHRLLRRERIDLVHAHLLGSALYGSLAAAPLGVPTISTFHGLPDIPTGGRLLRFKFRIIARRSNRVVFVSESLRRAVVERGLIPEAPTRVIYNGIAPPIADAGRDARREVGSTSYDFLVVAVGNVRPAKDYGNLLRAARLLRDDGVPLRILVLGEGHGALQADLVADRDALGLTEVVSFLGFVPDVTRYLAACDAFVCSSSNEGFSLSTVEALWMETPAVATRSGGPEEIIRDGETGWLVPARDPAALAHALHEVYTDGEAAAERARAGAKDVRARFSRDRMIVEYEALYHEVLGASVSDPT